MTTTYETTTNTTEERSRLARLAKRIGDKIRRLTPKFDKVLEKVNPKSYKTVDYAPMNGVIAGGIYKDTKSIYARFREKIENLLDKLGAFGNLIRIAKKIVFGAIGVFAIGVVIAKAIELIPKLLPVLFTYAAVSLIVTFMMNAISYVIG